MAGYAHINNWVVAVASKYLGIPVLHFCDANLLTPTGLLKQMVKEPVIRTFFALMAGFLYIGITIMISTATMARPRANCLGVLIQ